MVHLIFYLFFINLIIFSYPALAAQGPHLSEAASVPAERSLKDNPTLKEFGILTGYANTNAADKDDYVTLPMIFRLGIDFDKYGLGFSDWFQRGAKFFFHKDYRPAGTTEFLIEPFVSYVPSPDTNAEAGLVLLFKYAWPVTERFHPYIFNGGGVMYTTQHLREQSTQWNFTPQMGAGFSYFLNKNQALNVEFRYRHFSNANRKLPNDGINQNFILAGISWFY